MARGQKRKVNPFVVALLESLLGQAREGNLDAAFVVFRAHGGDYDYIAETNDIDDMILEVRTSVIRAQMDNGCAPPKKPRKQ